MNHKILIYSALIPLFAFSVHSSNAILLDFNDLQAGEIVTNQYEQLGISISATNMGWGPDIAIVFDSKNPTGGDSDLASPWSGGNIESQTNLEKILIIAENDIDSDNDGIIDRPDDEGNRPAGSIYFDFDSTMCSIGFDLIDVEGPSEYGNDSGFVATFFMDDKVLAKVGFKEFVNSNSIFYDSSVQFGNNKANHIMPISVDDLSEFSGKQVLVFDRVEINLGGSSAIDNINVESCNDIVLHTTSQTQDNQMEVTSPDVVKKDEVTPEATNAFSEFIKAIQNAIFGFMS